jgi:sodium/proline symporter
VGSITFLVSQWTAMGTAMESMLGIDYKYGVLIGAIIITLYVMAGGMLASMWTNFFQMIIMFVVALLLIVKSVNVSGGFVEMNHMIANINPTYVSPYGTYGVSYLLTYSILVCFLSYGGQPTLNTKFMMIKNTKELKWSPLISVVALIVGTSMFIVGIAGIVLVNNGTIEAPARADLILLSVIKAIFPPIVSALVLVAVMAAVMSTAESYLFNCSASLVRDLGEQFLGVQMNDKKSLRWSRIIMVLVAIFTVILAMRPPKMISVVGAQAFGAFCAGFGPVLYLGIRWKRVTSKAAIAGMSVGLVVAGIIPILDPNNMLMPKWTPAGMAALLSFVVTVIVTLITKPETSIVFDSVPQPAADATQETGAKASEQF